MSCVIIVKFSWVVSGRTFGRSSPKFIKQKKESHLPNCGQLITAGKWWQFWSYCALFFRAPAPPDYPLMQVSRMAFFIFTINQNEFLKNPLHQRQFLSLVFTFLFIWKISALGWNILWTNLRSSCSDVNSHHNKVVVCYVKGGSASRPGNGKFLVEHIDPMLCTHIIYAFAGLDNNATNSIQSRYSDVDTKGGGRGNKSKNSKNMRNFQF